MNLYVVRHGEVPSNLSEVVEERYDERLTEKGIEQSKKVGNELSNTKFDVIISSPSPRAVETTEYVAPNQDVIIDSRITERNMGKLVGEKWKDIDQNIWNSTEYEKTPEGAETLLSGLNRTKDFLNEIRKKYKGKNVLVVTHNFVSKCIWINETNETNQNEINNFWHANDEVKHYYEKDE